MPEVTEHDLADGGWRIPVVDYQVGGDKLADEDAHLRAHAGRPIRSRGPAAG